MEKYTYASETIKPVLFIVRPLAQLMNNILIKSLEIAAEMHKFRIKLTV